ncbi:MAG: phage protease [Pseudomonadota bacterium]
MDATSTPIRGALVSIAASAEGALPAEIALMPIGGFALRDLAGAEVERLELAASNVASVIASSFASVPGDALPIDFDHAMERPEGAGKIAAGWITALRVEGDRLMASVDWTTPGAEAIRGKSYRFISPTFFTDRAGKVQMIARAALTNTPAIHELPKIAQAGASEETDTMTLEELTKKLAQALGLGEGATADDVVAAATASAAQAGHATKIAAGAGIEDELDETGVTAILAKITAAASEGRPDPTKYVPKVQFDELSERVAKLQTASAQSAADDAVAKATREGKLTPAAQEWGRAYAVKDPAGFQQWAASAPVLVKGGEMLQGLAPTEEGQLTAEEKKVAAAVGVSEEAFLAQKTGKPLPAKKEA